MKGKISATPPVVEGAFILRFDWKEGGSHSLEYKMKEHLSAQEAAHELEKFAAMLRDIDPPIPTYQ
jgi:hypothetical protein